ncbi:phospholipase A1-IIgamma-like [Rosa rugosa]|uniref:phospholipase A1-IIgamma-like n=1 Tax=Rosa rugosa TaxID=74645 RepID=UPI002B417C12|nr:phospholipase A1-IIgamma-like [Rosa rugosa]
MGSIATRWRQLSGEKDWEGLLYPLDIDLRRYIIHYGERTGASRDAVITEPKSKNFGQPRYAKRHLFSKVGLEIGNPYKYVVRKYLYAAPKLPSSPGMSCMLGYVAVTTDEGSKVLGRRDVLISFRGAVLGHEKLGNPTVHLPWHTYYTNVDPQSPHNKTSCRDQAQAAVRELLGQYKDEEISVTATGHSMGAAFAAQTAIDLVHNGFNIIKPTGIPVKACLVTAILFACPPRRILGSQNVISGGLEDLHILRVQNKYDNHNEHHDVGIEFKIDTLKSPYLKNALQNVHDLQNYLHGVAGNQGESGFKLDVNRDLALVNKYVDGLKDEYNVVAKWWTEKNKSMVQMDDGSWVLIDHENDGDEGNKLSLQSRI